MRIGVIGGTGKEGSGLALRWARSGHTVTVGSRDAERGNDAAQRLSVGAISIHGGSNLDACEAGDVVVLCVPYAAHAETLRSLKSALDGKILVDITVPLKPPHVRRVHLPAGRAAALEAQSILTDSKVVAALHHVSSVHLADPNHAIDCDVLVCSDDGDARSLVVGLIADLGLRGLDAGPLENAIALEALTPVLLHLNKVYKSTGIGIRFTGIP